MQGWNVEIWSRIDGNPYSARIEVKLCLGETDAAKVAAAYNGAKRPKGLRKTRTAYVVKTECEVHPDGLVVTSLSQRGERREVV